MLLPDWDAVMLQVPAATRLSVLPLTVQIKGVVEANCTVRPELTLADSAAGVVPRVWLPGDAKVMSWVPAGITVKL